jgi:hypothetical protein
MLKVHDTKQNKPERKDTEKQNQVHVACMR